MNKYVCTAEAAELLEMNDRRFRSLLQKGRVKGAYKSGKSWIIPLYDGLPIIAEGTRGPKGTWKKENNSQQE